MTVPDKKPKMTSAKSIEYRIVICNRHGGGYTADVFELASADYRYRRTSCVSDRSLKAFLTRTRNQRGKATHVGIIHRRGRAPLVDHDELVNKVKAFCEQTQILVNSPCPS